MKPLVLAAAVLAGGGSLHAASRPGLLADLPDDVLAAVARESGSTSSPAATLDAVFKASEPYLFSARGVRVYTDRRWFEATSAEGDGAPILELRRWPGDTVLAYYELAPTDEAGTGVPTGVKLGGRRGDAGDWSCRDAKLTAPRGDYDSIWCEYRAGTSRRLGALGIPGDAGLGAGAVPDLRDAILAVLRRTTVEATDANNVAPPILPELPDPPAPADERHQSWGAFATADFTLGLPPGIRAIRLDAGVPPPRPMPPAAAWVRGRFTDRNGVSVVVGDGVRAGYVAILQQPDEAWRAGVAAPLGGADAERSDEARLDDTVLEWTGASRVVVSHWKEPGFAGDWLVFRLLVSGRGVEIGLPVLSGWRSLALFWVPVTFRGAGLPPAPPPIDPAESLGVRFDRLSPGEAKRNGLVEGSLVVADLRLDVPRGWWPIANLGSRDGLPVTFVDQAGNVIGEISRRPAGSADLAPKVEEGWEPVAKPSAQNAGAIWSKSDGSAVLVAKDGHGFLLAPNGDVPARREGWRRMRESSDFIKKAARR